MEYPAIDFKQLLRDEKLRARRERQRRSEQNGSSDHTDHEHDKETALATTKIRRPQIDTEATTITSSSSEEEAHNSAMEIPDDWLNASSSSSIDDIHDVSFPISLDRIQHCVSQDPPSIYYIPNFLPSSSQEYLKTWLSQLPHAAAVGDNTSPNGKWTTLRYARRRVALLDGRLDGGLPRPIQQLALALVEAGIFSVDTPPNHVLINEYFEPSQGIMPHTDGPLYAPTTATISMGGGDVLLNFTPRRQISTDSAEPSAMAILSNSQETPEPVVCKQVWLQGNGSLVVFTEDAYTSHLHGIDEHVQVEEASSVCANAAPGTPIIRGYRISLTFRHKLVVQEQLLGEQVEEA